jgi:hypothetical protein
MASVAPVAGDRLRRMRIQAPVPGPAMRGLPDASITQVSSPGNQVVLRSAAHTPGPASLRARSSGGSGSISPSTTSRSGNLWARSAMVQPLLMVGGRDGPFEQEADRVAGAIVGDTVGSRAAPASPSAPQGGRVTHIQRCGSIPSADCPCHGSGALALAQHADDGSIHVARAAPITGSTDTAHGRSRRATPLVESAVTAGSGAPLDPGLRPALEARIGSGFEGVRVHTDDAAAAASASIGARAYTHGSDIFFGRGEFAPETTAGLHTLVHELVHVVQQSAGNQTQVQRLPVFDEAGGDGGILSPLTAPSTSGTGPPATAGIFPSLPSLSLPPPCRPATSAFQARALHAFVSASFIPFARGMFGADTAGLWMDYLNTSLSLPRPSRSFVGSGTIPAGFTAHHKSAEAEREVVFACAAALVGPAASLMPAPGTSAVVPVSSIVGATTLAARINNDKDPMGLDFDAPATTIPGNIAGGIGAGGPPGGTAPDPDRRAVDGSVQLDLDPAGTTLTITPRLTFFVHDTVDFCPGFLGASAVARVETIPMSILEGTEARFGPVFAADVPFDVLYPGPGVARTVTVPAPAPPTPPTPVPPTPVPPVPTFPRSGPAKTTGTFLRIRTGPSLSAPVLRLIPASGTPINVITQVHGDDVEGIDAWDQISEGFVSHRFVAFDPP